MNTEVQMAYDIYLTNGKEKYTAEIIKVSQSHNKFEKKENWSS